MSGYPLQQRAAQSGMALIASLLLLVVVTILGIAMFRSFGLQEIVAGNTREKTKAVQSAESAEEYAEWWLTENGAVNATSGVTCGAGVLNANSNNIQICSNTLASAVADVSVVPWVIGGSESAVAYTPPYLNVGTNAVNIYYQAPRFYISYLSGSYNATIGAQTNNYTIDAVGYGGTSNAVAIVEAGYTVTQIFSTTGSLSKFVNLGGP
ncbi:MAG TPA: PilX N-terminal domain-containing pilus assembly protein [Steroidobacteraceae bacterium]|nr:PilX N-terminal domain-containing pilus assembly protein [Steroidobacteraceae bacterium]